MPSSLTIPLTTLPVGTLNFGPSSVADADVSLTLTIDRTVTGGLNSLTSATAINAQIWQSNDGGATWQEIGEVGINGGTFVTKTGATATVSVMGPEHLLPGTSRQLRATVTVTGTAVAVAGTLTTQ